MKFLETSINVIEELKSVFELFDYNQVNKLISYIEEANRIVLIGVGREGLATKSFSMRLMHLGKDVHWIWDDTTPGIYEGDLLIATNGSGNIGHINYVIQKAKEHLAKVFVVTGDPSGLASNYADEILFLPASVYLGNAEVVESMQPMGNLFEQSLWIMFDIVVMMISEEYNISKEDMELRHRNLE